MRLENHREFEKIIVKYQDRLVRFAFFRTGSYADAQDIVQDVFIKFFEKDLNLIRLRNPKSFLFKSIYNACIDFGRIRKLKTVSMESAPELRNMEDSGHHELNDEFKRISYLLKDLPEEQKEVVRLRVIDELSFKEISRTTGIPLPTAKSRYKYGIAKIKENVQSKKEVGNEVY